MITDIFYLPYSFFNVVVDFFFFFGGGGGVALLSAVVPQPNDLNTIETITSNTRRGKHSQMYPPP